eukprot:13843164-Heterocapsa_arctica.AAC.1
MGTEQRKAKAPRRTWLSKQAEEVEEVTSLGKQAKEVQAQANWEQGRRTAIFPGKESHGVQERRKHATQNFRQTRSLDRNAMLGSKDGCQ